MASTKLPEAVRREAARLAEDGLSFRGISQRLGISLGSVSHLLRGRRPPEPVEDVGSKPAVDVVNGLRPGLLHSEKWAQPGQRCDAGHLVLVWPCRTCRIGRLNEATLAARRIGLAFDDALVRSVRRRITPQNRDAVECLIDEYGLAVFKLGGPGEYLRNAPLVQAVCRLRRLLELIATGAWTGAGAPPTPSKRQDNRGARPAVNGDENIGLRGRKIDVSP